MEEDTPTCDWEKIAGGPANEAGHAFLHMTESAAVLSVAQSIRTLATAAATGVLVAYLFTLNWWVFAGAVALVLFDIYVHSVVLRAEEETGQWVGVTLDLTKAVTARVKVAEAMWDHYRNAEKEK